jgi:hypothetical protein
MPRDVCNWTSFSSARKMPSRLCPYTHIDCDQRARDRHTQTQTQTQTQTDGRARPTLTFPFPSPAPACHVPLPPPARSSQCTSVTLTSRCLPLSRRRPNGPPICAPFLRVNGMGCYWSGRCPSARGSLAQPLPSCAAPARNRDAGYLRGVGGAQIAMPRCI